MTYEERESVYFDAFDLYGPKHQIGVAVEELLELGKELQKYANRGIDTRKNITEEMADVVVALEQLYLFFENKKDVSAVVSEKVARLKKEIEKKTTSKCVVVKVVRR